MKRQFFFNFRKDSKAVLIDSDTALKIDRYRGQTDDFLQNIDKYELEYLDDMPRNQFSNLEVLEGEALIEGRCTHQGSKRFAQRA